MWSRWSWRCLCKGVSSAGGAGNSRGSGSTYCRTYHIIFCADRHQKESCAMAPWWTCHCGQSHSATPFLDKALEPSSTRSRGLVRKAFFGYVRMPEDLWPYVAVANQKAPFWVLRFDPRPTNWTPLCKAQSNLQESKARFAADPPRNSGTWWPPSCRAEWMWTHTSHTLQHGKDVSTPGQHWAMLLLWLNLLSLLTRSCSDIL